jgi:predicted TIM-barrel fold metal-dependent hydrolase
MGIRKHRDRAQMRFIDTHIHLDPNSQNSLKEQIDELQRELSRLGGSHGILLHLDWQKFDKKSIADEVKKYENLSAYVNITPGPRGSLRELSFSVGTLGYKGLKLHPRLNNFKLLSRDTFLLCREAGNLGIPVLIDAFIDGKNLKQEILPRHFAVLAEKCSGTNFIWAHMGGYKVLDFLFLGKPLPNVYMDFSFTLQYFQGSSVIQDVVYAMRNMKFDRIFYGSDYPDRPLGVALNIAIDTLRSHGLSDDDLEKLFFANASKYLGL